MTKFCKGTNTSQLRELKRASFYRSLIDAYWAENPLKAEDYRKNMLVDAWLEFNTSIGVSRIHITSSPFIFGRTKESVDCFIENRFISGVHAEIYFKSGVFFLRDLGSRNGTFLNDIRMKPFLEASLCRGDRISFADVVFCFEELHGLTCEAEW